MSISSGYEISQEVGKVETEEKEENDPKTSHVTSGNSHGNIVAAHYNEIEEKGLEVRYKSPILYLRNFNNWIKSVLIIEYVNDIRAKDYGRPIKVLDMCCGKGGDIMKWQNQRVKHLTFVDIADVAVEQCQKRYENGMKKFIEPQFTAEFIVADCSKQALREKYKDPSIAFDIVSCQFGLHYSFESLPQARRMFNNISECLCPGGFFIGTIPDANEIVARAKKSSDWSFGNRIYNIKLLFNPNEVGYPLFGAKYDFQLEGVVNCPEFLVNFELCKKIAAEYGLELVYKGRFEDFFNKFKNDNKHLMYKLQCLEAYPPADGENLIGEAYEYFHAKRFADDNNSKKLGTMSACEWEAAKVSGRVWRGRPRRMFEDQIRDILKKAGICSAHNRSVYEKNYGCEGGKSAIYMAFAFRKKKSTWDMNGKPVYET